MDGVTSVNAIKFARLNLGFNKNILMPSLENSYKTYADPDTYKKQLNKYIDQIKKNPSTRTNFPSLNALMSIFPPSILLIFSISSLSKKATSVFNLSGFFYDGDKNYDFSNEKLTLKNNKKDKQVTANVQLLSNLSCYHFLNYL